MNGLLDKVVNIFIGAGSIFTGVLLAWWIYHYLLEFISDELDRSNVHWGVGCLIFILTLLVFGFLSVAISYKVFQLVDGFFNALQTFEFQLFE